jgi:hypothetical protein
MQCHKKKKPCGAYTQGFSLVDGARRGSCGGCGSRRHRQHQVKAAPAEWFERQHCKPCKAHLRESGEQQFLSLDKVVCVAAGRATAQKLEGASENARFHQGRFALRVSFLPGRQGQSTKSDTLAYRCQPKWCNSHSAGRASLVVRAGFVAIERRAKPGEQAFCPHCMAQLPARDGPYTLGYELIETPSGDR